MTTGTLEFKEYHSIQMFRLEDWIPNIKNCPICLTKYIPTPQSPKKCLFCARKLLTNKKQLCLLNQRNK